MMNSQMPIYVNLFSFTCQFPQRVHQYPSVTSLAASTPGISWKRRLHFKIKWEGLIFIISVLHLTLSSTEFGTPNIRVHLSMEYASYLSSRGEREETCKPSDLLIHTVNQPSCFQPYFIL